MKNCNTCKANKVCNHDIYGFENCDNYISAEVVEVVRCKDCIYKHTAESIPLIYCKVLSLGIVRPVLIEDNDFCSFGKRAVYCKDKEDNLRHCKDCHETCER